MPELLAKQHLNVRLIINYENKEVHVDAPALPRAAALRGRVMRNVVNSPGIVSTEVAQLLRLGPNLVAGLTQIRNMNDPTFQ
jgi:hypothetical protein